MIQGFEHEYEQLPEYYKGYIDCLQLLNFPQAMGFYMAYRHFRKGFTTCANSSTSKKTKRGA